MEHATQQEVAQDSRHVTSVCKRHEPVFCVLLHLCKSTCGRPHTRTDTYDAARSVSWLPEVSSSTISPVCYHMGVPCAMLKQAYYLFQFSVMREEQQSH